MFSACSESPSLLIDIDICILDHGVELQVNPMQAFRRICLAINYFWKDEFD